MLGHMLTGEYNPSLGAYAASDFTFFGVRYLRGEVVDLTKLQDGAGNNQSREQFAAGNIAFGDPPASATADLKQRRADYDRGAALKKKAKQETARREALKVEAEAKALAKRAAKLRAESGESELSGAPSAV